MCGLVGFYNGSVFGLIENIESNLKKMTDAIIYRGPDGEGRWYDQDNKIALGHRRLAIQDLSDAGFQPMHSLSNRYVLVFNGEIYNHLSLRKELELLNPSIIWDGSSDTETILKCVEYIGLECTLKKLEGMFAIALWDKKEKVLFLARDRFGEKPLYYGWQNDSFVFASELKSIVQYDFFEREIESRALVSLLRHGYIASPYSIWKKIYKIPPGHYVKIDSNKGVDQPLPVCYWSIKDVVTSQQQVEKNQDINIIINETEKFLIESIKGRMISDVPIGALLSGGIDSSLVVALMQKLSMRPIKTFSIGFEDIKFNESKYAELVAECLGTEHKTLIMTPNDLINLVPYIAQIYDEPFADSSQLPTVMVSKLAKNHITVALTGDGGDEIFCGYKRYFFAEKVWRVYKWIPFFIRKNFLSLIFNVRVEKWDFLIKKIFKHFSTQYIGDKIYKIAERFAEAENFNNFYLGFVTNRTNLTDILNNIEDFPYLLNTPTKWPSIKNHFSRMMAVDTMTYMVDDILVKIDRASMATSLELRAPFLNHYLFEYAWSLPIKLKARHNNGKWILKQILYKYIPKEVVEKPKQGFSVPLDDWLRGPLKNWAEELLFSSELYEHDLLKQDGVKKLWYDHLYGKRQLGPIIWSILMFLSWYKINFYDNKGI